MLDVISNILVFVIRKSFNLLLERSHRVRLCLYNRQYCTGNVPSPFLCFVAKASYQVSYPYCGFPAHISQIMRR